jgi:hypothetical protein
VFGRKLKGTDKAKMLRLLFSSGKQNDQELEEEEKLLVISFIEHVSC